MTPRSPQSSLFPQEQESVRTNPWGGGPVTSPQGEESPPFFPPESSETLSLQCPQCRGRLKLKREHLGIEGACVQCGTPIKAVAYPTGQIGIELLQAGAPSTFPQAAQQESSFLSPQTGEPNGEAGPAGPVTLETNVHGIAEPLPSQLDQQSSSVWSPVEQPETPASPPFNAQIEAPAPPTNSQQHFESPAPPANTPPLEPSNAAWQEPVQPDHSGSGLQEDSDETTWSHSSMFQTGSASTPQQPQTSQQQFPQSPPPSFQDQNSAPSLFQTPAAPPPLSEPAFQSPNPQQVDLQPQTPGDVASPFQSPPAEQAFPSSSTPLPWASQAPPELPTESPENFQEYKAASPFDQNKQDEEFAPLPEGQPEVTVTSGKKNRLGGTRRKSGYGLLKTLGVALLLGGLFFAAIIFTPKEKLDEAKRWAHEFVKPAIDVFNAGKDGNSGEESGSGPSSDGTGAPLPEPAKANGLEPVRALPDGEQSADSNLRAGSADPGVSDSAPVSESLRVNREGGSAIREFYNATELKSRAEFVLDRRKNLSRMEAFYSETSKLPTLNSLKFQKAVRSSESGRWFGIFEVDESDDEKIHRWIAVEDGEGGFKLDWAMYEQTINNGLQRFLDDPTAGTREFRVSLVRGDPVPEQNNPWNSDAVGLYLKSPFDGQAARPIILRSVDFERLGLSEKLVGQTPRLARLEMSWVPSEYDRNSRVPVVTKLFGWGAW